MKMRIALFSLIVLALFIAGCGGAEEAPPAPTNTPQPPPPSSTPEPTATPEPTPTVTPIFVDTETLNILHSVLVPENDRNVLAQMFKGVGELTPLEPPATDLEVGATDTFWITNYDDEQIEIPATLQYVTDHAYFWVHDTAQFDPDELETLANTFENKIYPNNQAFFGSEWSPGIDGDPHIYILYARGLAMNVGGYYSTGDELHPDVSEFSNAHEMFVFNAGSVGLAEEYTLGLFAHEYQHMIHWNTDRNEDSWIDEGAAQVAELINRYNPGGSDTYYVNNTDIQLNTWSDSDDEELWFSHYGGSFLFMAYFLDRFGEETTQALINHPANGFQGIDLVLTELGITDPMTNEPILGDDFFVDWALANYIGDDDVEDGRYYYSNYIAPRAKQTDVIRDCEADLQEYDVHQYGVDYIRILCTGQFTLNFEGQIENRVVPADPYSGEYFFWSNSATESNTTLSQTFDFSGVEAPITLTFWTWYDIEKNWDYAFISASTDGETWTTLQGTTTTDSDPQDANYGWGFTGTTRSSEWVQESVDLSEFAGQEVTLRFDYITDAVLNYEGMLIDDVAIEEIGYFTDFETDDGGWIADGFVRIKNVLPQTFRLALIHSGETITVEYIPVGVNNLASVSLDIAEEGESVVLVVAGTTRYTHQTAMYTLSFTR